MYRTVVLFLLDVIFAGLFASTIWPVKRQIDVIPAQVAQRDQYLTLQLEVDAPAYLRQGETGQIDLSIRMDQEEMRNVNLPLEARLEIPGIPARDREIITSFDSGKGSSLSWEVKTDAAGKYNGKIWLWVGEPNARQLILAAPIEIDCRPVWPVRVLGAGGSIMFTALGGLALRQARKKTVKIP